MSRLSIEELPYEFDSTSLFERIGHLEQPIFLDSSAPHCARGRYDILCAQPKLTLAAEPNPGSGTAFFDAIRRAIDDTTPPLDNDYHLPFLGGAVGYFGYDLGHGVQHLPERANRDINLPPAQVGLYSWAIIVDHRQQRTVLIAHPSTTPGELAAVRHLLHAAPPATAPFRLRERFRSNFSKTTYLQAFAAAQSYIAAGDCYQVNLAQRYVAACEGDPWRAYLALRRVTAAPFSAFLRFGSHAILSCSPERFLHTANGRVTTSPIKGTRKRGATPEADQFLARQLLSSSKDRAENLMIVDLLRNDLGKACAPGTILVNELFELQSFETVHHLVSTISGQLRTDCDALALLAGCFPGGSITGAPKLRAMQIIAELEPHQRSVYCGAIGYISCDGQMDTNIAIRTLLCDQTAIYGWAGGGIVADSEADSEYEECASKIGPMLKALEGLSR